MNLKVMISAAALAACAALPAMAQEAGTWTLGLGVHTVNPKSGNGTIAGADASIGSSTRPTITGEYFIRDNLGIEVLGALPFKHDVALGGSRIGSVKQLPPVISLQYHFVNDTRITPFLGLGLNYTTFFSESSPLGDLKVEDSWGLAAHLGADIALNDRSWLRIDARWADIDAKVKLNGADIGTANIDPTVYGVSYVMRF